MQFASEGPAVPVAPQGVNVWEENAKSVACAGSIKSKLLEKRSNTVSKCRRIPLTDKLYFKVHFRPSDLARITLKSANFWASLPMSVGVTRFSGPGSIGRSGERKRCDEERG